MVRDKNQKEFDLSLVKHVRIKVIDNIDFDQNLITKEKEGLCEERERVYWQHHLKTLEKFGGMTVHNLSDFACALLPPQGYLCSHGFPFLRFIQIFIQSLFL